MSDTEQAGGNVVEGEGGNGDGPTPARAVDDVDPVTGEIVPASSSGVMFADVIGDAAITAYLADMRADDGESPEAIQAEIARRILSAPDIASVWQATKVLTAKDVLNAPIVVERVRWVTSAHEGGAPKFAIIEGKRVYGDEPVTISCGALNVVLTLYKLQKFDGLPARVMIAQKPSASGEGRTVFTIEPVAG